MAHGKHTASVVIISPAEPGQLILVRSRGNCAGHRRAACPSLQATVQAADQPLDLTGSRF